MNTRTPKTVRRTLLSEVHVTQWKNTPKNDIPTLTTPRKEKLTAAEYKSLLGFRADNKDHYIVLRSDIMSYMRMHNIWVTTKPSAEAWDALAALTQTQDAGRVFRARHAPAEQSEWGIQSLLRDCVYQVQ